MFSQDGKTLALLLLWCTEMAELNEKQSEQSVLRNRTKSAPGAIEPEVTREVTFLSFTGPRTIENSFSEV